jgi:acyl-CoA thioester hydrolase
MLCKTTTEIRVRYGETDQMGFVYYGNYALYLEQGRTDWLRKMGFSYKELEAQNILLPVTQFSINYHAPGRYDDLLLIETTLVKMPGVKIQFSYAIFNEDQKQLITAETTLAFVDKNTMKITPAPEYLIEAIAKCKNLLNQ